MYAFCPGVVITKFYESIEMLHVLVLDIGLLLFSPINCKIMHGYRRRLDSPRPWPVVGPWGLVRPTIQRFSFISSASPAPCSLHSRHSPLPSYQWLPLHRPPRASHHLRHHAFHREQSKVFLWVEQKNKEKKEDSHVILQYLSNSHLFHYNTRTAFPCVF